MLGQIIRQLRQERGIKQEELGRCLGVTKQSVSNWENDNIMPSVELLLKIADYFGVTLDFLTGRTERNTLDVTGLTESQITHIQLIVDDIRMCKK